MCGRGYGCLTSLYSPMLALISLLTISVIEKRINPTGLMHKSLITMNLKF